MGEYCSGNPLIRWYFRTRLTLVLELSQRSKCSNNVVLDIGCGNGVLLPALSNFTQVIGIGLKHSLGIRSLEETKSLLKRYATDGEIELMYADVVHLPFREHIVSRVFCISVLEHVRNVKKAIRETKRVMGRGGLLICGVPTETAVYRSLRWVIGDPDPGHFHTGREMFRYILDQFDLEDRQGIPLLYDIGRFRKKINDCPQNSR